VRFAVIVFPGSNCDVDMYHAVKDVLKEEVEYVQHDCENLSTFDAILLPGGFSYGDYLRSGAIARFSPVMKEVIKMASEGKPILGVCNGFQILLEAGLLPGAMRRNHHLTFVCKNVQLRVMNNQTMFTSEFEKDEVITIPVAHGEGNYYCDKETLNQLIQNRQIIFTYENGNPNGSIENIAGIMNDRGNVLGMMPHPERAVEKLLGNNDGIKLFQSIVKYWRETYVVNA